jgi:acyl carrier protein
MAAAKEQDATQQSSTIKDQIRDFVSENLAGPKGIASFTDDESLTENGVVDSLGIFRLVAFLEESFGVRVGDEEINADNLRSINIMEQFVVSKTSK